MSRINLYYGSGGTTAIIDLARDQIELYWGDENFRRYDGGHDPNSFHARHGGRQYYMSRSGASGAGWIPAKPHLKQVWTYRVDTSFPELFMGNENHTPEYIGGYQIWAPYDYRGNTQDDWPVIMRSKEGDIVFADVWSVASVLREEADLVSREYVLPYIKNAEAEPAELRLTVRQEKHTSFPNARRVLEAMHYETVRFEYPEGWTEEGDAEFWRRLGIRRMPQGYFKVVKGVCYARHEEWTLEVMREAVPANVHPIAPDLYVQERNDYGRTSYVAVGRFEVEGSWYDYEVVLEEVHALRLFGASPTDDLVLGLRSELEAGARAKHEREAVARIRLEQQAKTELERNETLKRLIEEHGDLLLTVEDSLAAGNCEVGTRDFARRYFEARESASVREIARFVSVYGVRRVLEHKLLPLLETKAD